MNDALARRPNNNTNDNSNNITSESSNNIANQEFNQTFATTRQTRSFGRGTKVVLESLDSIEELSQSELRKQQQYKIDRIIDDSPNETLGQFYHANKVAMTQVYKQFFALIHPNKQSKEWKEKINQTQQSK